MSPCILSLIKSEGQDSNLRSPVYQTSALNQLGHLPKTDGNKRHGALLAALPFELREQWKFKFNSS